MRVGEKLPVVFFFCSSVQCSVLPSAYGMLVISRVFTSSPNMTHSSSWVRGSGCGGLGEGCATQHLTCQEMTLQKGE